ncbi:hypothetical protein I553_1185 [Mycobacterium xenopi 4042]|uniref:Secreted protein n=1 Tax=Mycobacterium xenopi 4042 TaxID=1299334 RepID=X7ZCA0_MYCXE|nr:hypothetical protein I553_1185 [Mycobacterium xenopi 4042]
MPISSVIIAAVFSASASSSSAVARAHVARCAKVVRRYSANRACARPMAASISSGVAGVKVWTVSPVAGLMVAMGMLHPSAARYGTASSLPLSWLA